MCSRANSPGVKRRVEVSSPKPRKEDQARFQQAMNKEWQSWLENKVTTIVKAREVLRVRVIGSRWVLTWKKSSDPDDQRVTSKTRLVLVGYQDLVCFQEMAAGWPSSHP